MYNEESSPNINNNLSMEWTVGFTQDQTNTNSINIRNTGITQNCKEQINALRQNSAEPVKENVHLVSSVSRHKKRNIFKKCKECKFRKSHYDEDFNQCKDCYRASIRILSGNKLIDDFIKSTQTFYKNCKNRSKLEFIPYKQFTNIEYLNKGGFSEIYKATWVDGPITRWCPKKKRFNRKGNYDVVLKILNNSEKMDSDYLNELKHFFHCRKDGDNDGPPYITKVLTKDNIRVDNTLHQYLGITQHPETKKYVIVIEFAQNNDLHYFLSKKANTLSWLEKLRLLYKISIGLNLIHQRKIIHRDLHSGNILISQNNEPAIADLGISKPVNELSDSIYGIIPYIAPEVFKERKFTEYSDIYSFGMIIWEVISGRRPFSDRKHDEYLILNILDGLRPKIPNNIPHELVEFMEICWHRDPKKRKQVLPNSFWNVREGYWGNELYELIRRTEEGEIKFPENECTNILQPKINDQAVYSSRLLNSLINKALTLQSTDDDSRAIEFDINQPFIKF